MEDKSHLNNESGSNSMTLEMPKTPTILIGGDGACKDHQPLDTTINSVGSVDSCPPEMSLNVNTTAAHLKRAPSETTVSFTSEGAQWERSQSEANLSVLKNEVEAAISSLGGCIVEEAVTNASSGNITRPKGLVSEQARVYWNLPEAVDDEPVANGVVSANNVSASNMSPQPSAGAVSMSSLTSCGTEPGVGTAVEGIYIHTRGSVSSEPARSSTHLCLDGGADERMLDNRGRLPSGHLACTLNTIPQQDEVEGLSYSNVPGLEQFTEVSRSMPEAINSPEHLASSIAGGYCTKPIDSFKTVMSIEEAPVVICPLSHCPTTIGNECPATNFIDIQKLSSNNVDSWELFSSSEDSCHPLHVPNCPSSNASSCIPRISPNSLCDTQTSSILLRGWSGIDGVKESDCSAPLLETPLVPAISGSVLTNFVQHVKQIVRYKEQLLQLSSAKSIQESSFADETGVDDCLNNVNSCIEQLEKAWQMPQHGRDLAIAMCSCVREEGLLHVLAQLSANVEALLDNEEMEQHHLLHLLRRSCHLLSQVLTKVNCNLLLQMSRPPLQPSTNSDFSTSKGDSKYAPNESSIIAHIVQCAWAVRKRPPWSRKFVAILSGVLKQHSSTCDLVLQCDGLRVLTFACRSLDVPTLRHTVLALTNLALYARGAHIVEQIARGGVAHWLFPAAMHEDTTTRYYACLCIAVLWTLATTPGSCLMTRGVHILSSHTTINATNSLNNGDSSHMRDEKARLLISSRSAGGWCGTGTQAAQLLAQEVQRSGTLNLVWPFIRSHTPIDFAHHELLYFHSRSKGWLQRLLPVLACEREEVQALAAFHFALEARVKVNQRRASLFQEIGALPLLLEVASSAHYLAAQFAADALQYLGENVPLRLCPDVSLWRESDVLSWLNRVGFSQLAPAFQESRVDGETLLSLNEDMLKEDLHLQNGILRQRFLRELVRLKCGCSYSRVDSTGLSKWLRVHLGSEYVQYTYPLLRAGLNRLDLPQLLFCSNDVILSNDCGIRNGLHRARFLALLNDCVFPDNHRSLDRVLPLDNVFICYRRNSSASHLASLLKVHLQLRGYNVLMDVESLCAGQFPSTVFHNISVSRHFLLVLTRNTFSACQRDEAHQDPIHKEIMFALKKKCRLIPVMDDFEWPPDVSLPRDVREITQLDGIRWVYENQDASIDQIQAAMLNSDLPSSYVTSELPQTCLSGEHLPNSLPCPSSRVRD